MFELEMLAQAFPVVPDDDNHRPFVQAAGFQIFHKPPDLQIGKGDVAVIRPFPKAVMRRKMSALTS